MDERPWRRRESLLKRLGLWGSKEGDMELAGNILTGAEPWSGPPSGNTSKDSLLNAKERLSGSESSSTGRSPEVSQTRIEDRIVNPDPSKSGEVEQEADLGERTSNVTHKAPSGKRSYVRRMSPEERLMRLTKSDSRYRIPRGQQKTVWKLDQGGCHQCGCAHNCNRGLKNSNTSWSTVGTERQSYLEDTRSEQVPVERAPGNLNWAANRSSWSHISQKPSRSSWSHIRRGSSLNSLSHKLSDSNSFVGRARELNPFKSVRELRKTDLDNDGVDVDDDDDYDEPSGAVKVMQEVERKLSLCGQKTVSMLSQKAMSAKERLGPSLTKCQRIFLDVFLLVLVILIFVSWFGSRWGPSVRITTTIGSIPPSLASCHSCGQTASASPVCSSCQDIFSPFQTIGEHMKIFTNAFSEKYRTLYK